VKHAIIFVLILLVAVPVTFAAPSITAATGAMVQNGTITISGSGFGSHADFNIGETYLNTRWKNFNDNSLQSGAYTLEIIITDGAATKTFRKRIAIV
jgi:hypothetical protein